MEILSNTADELDRLEEAERLATAQGVLQDEAMMRTAARARDDLIPALVATIAMIDTQGRSFSNAATAADTQRTALRNLANFQLSLLDPVGNVIRLTGELKTAQEELATALEDGETPASDLALAALAVEEAFLRLQSAGSALTADQIQAFAQVLTSQLGMSEKQVLDTLDAMNLLDGWTGSATFTLTTINKTLGDLFAGNIAGGDAQPRQHGGPVWAGRPYIVGERGPEVMIPQQSGTVISNLQLAGLRPNVTGPTIVVQSPMKDFRTDLQYATILASVTNMVESQ